MEPEKSNRLSPLKWLTLAALFILVLIVFRGALENGFVNWDDHEYVYENPRIQSFSKSNLWEMATGFHAGNWHPLTWLSHAIDYQLFGLDPWGHHLTNILLHAFNTCLVFVLFLKLFKSAANNRFSEKNVWVGGMIAALVFGLHPLRVESVAWVAERKDLLCGLFFLSTILMFVFYITSKSEVEKKRFYLLSIFTFVLALMSKPMAVTLPAVLLLLDVSPFDRIKDKAAFWRLLLEKGPFFLLSALSVIVTFVAQKSGEAIRTLEESGLADRLINAVRSVSFYLEQTLWPGQLVPFYPFPENVSVISGAFLGSALVILAITALALVLWQRGKKFWMIAWLYYLVTVSPVIGIIRVGAQAAADRYTYLPTLSLYLLLGAFVVWALEINRASFKNFLSIGALAIGFVVLLILGALTVRQIPVWKNGETLWQEVVQAFPESPRAYANLGLFYSDGGQYDRALKNYEQALALYEVHKRERWVAAVSNNIGMVYQTRGEYDRALEMFSRALEVNQKLGRESDIVTSFNNMGLVYFAGENYSQAAEQFQSAINRNPELSEVSFNLLGEAYKKQGAFKKAEESFKAALKINPDFVDTHNKLGVVYYETGRVKEAQAEYQKALSLDPGHKDAHNNLGIVYYATGALNAAEQAFKRVLEIDSGHLDARNNLGVVYYEMAQLDAAEKEFQAVLKAAPKRADTRFYLGMVYSEKDRFDAAEAELLASLKIQPDYAHARNQLGFVFA